VHILEASNVRAGTHFGKSWSLPGNLENRK